MSCELASIVLVGLAFITGLVLGYSWNSPFFGEEDESDK